MFTTLTSFERCDSCGKIVGPGTRMWRSQLSRSTRCMECFNQQPSPSSPIRVNLTRSEPTVEPVTHQFDDLSILKFIQNEYSQVLADKEFIFGYNQAGGHIEYYKFVNLLAIPIYDTKHTRVGLLVIDPLESDERIKFRVEEELIMLERLQLGPARRRIKMAVEEQIP